MHIFNDTRLLMHARIDYGPYVDRMARERTPATRRRRGGLAALCLCLAATLVLGLI